MAASGNNGVLYAVIGALGMTVAGGAWYVLGNSPMATAPPGVETKVNPPAVTPTQTLPLSVPTSPERDTLAKLIDQSIAAGDFAYADRLVADAMQRYAGNAAWPPLQQKLATARAERAAQLRQNEARRLIAEARRYAQVGDFADAESMLQQAAQQAPGLGDISQARNDVAKLSAERNQLYRERYQFESAIDHALAGDRFWEAERLLSDYAQRFGVDDGYRVRNARLAEMRNAVTAQARVNEARAHIASARQAMARGDFAEAERQLAVADGSAPGFPETNAARSDLSRQRIAAETQQDEIALILRALDQALQTRRFDDADRAIEDGRRRFGAYPGWTDLQRRATEGRQGNETNARQAEELRARNVRAVELATAARQSAVRGDVAAADRSLIEASALAPNLPEVAIARAEIERAKADKAREEADARAVAASADAALARRQYDDAERLIGDGTKRYPAFVGWADLNRKLASERHATPDQAPKASPPPLLQPNNAAVPDVNPRVAELLVVARDALKRSDLAAAEKATAEADKLDPKATLALHAEIATARGEQARQEKEVKALTESIESALARQQFAEAEREIADGIKRYPTFAGWRDLSHKLVLQRSIGTLVATARAAIKRSDFAAAESSIAEAEKLDSKDKMVNEVRSDLDALKGKNPESGKPIQRGNRN
jgi:hypothetical protein